MRALTAAVFFLLFHLPASWAAEALVQFETAAEQAHYQLLVKRYRCLKCQNQNLADSAADLAGDLRREIALQVKNGKSTHEIDDYLIQRYGEFVLYKPKFSGKNLLLWIGPFVLLLAAVVGAIRMIRNPQKKSPVVADSDLHRARQLLKD